jgi:hypothetical protein
MKMIIDVVSDIIKALNSDVLDNDKLLHDNIESLMQETSLVWRKDYTIAVAKDDSKRKVANFMVCNKLDEAEQTFKVKREKDFWRKLEVRDDYEAVVECSLFSRDTPLCEIETIGRDLMRSRKEVPSVASKGFVWVVHIAPQENLDKLFQLYFKEDYLTLNQDEARYYIGWTDNLKALDMRNFICDPTAKKVESEIEDFSAEVDYDDNSEINIS